MKVYLAAPYAVRDTVRDLAAELARIGFTITSSWLDEKHDITPGTEKAATDLTDAQVSAHARQDMNDIDVSDLLVLFTAKACGAEGGGGRHIETGYALARGIPVIVVGDPENVFHRLGPSRVTVVPNWHGAVIEASSRLIDAERRAPKAGTCAGGC
jgi:nucleoside 2-deoxyribosyltransferase